MDIWSVIKAHFHKGEKWGDPDEVDPILLMVLFMLRREIGKPFSIHNAYDPPGTHSDKSYHYIGEAVDFHIIGLTLLEASATIEKVLKELKLWDKVGLGIYPDWNKPGFHLDIRGYKARWSAQYHYKVKKVRGRNKKIRTQEYYGYDYGKQYAKIISGK